MRQEPEHGEAVVHGHRNHALAGQARPIVARFRAVAGHESPAEEIDEHGQAVLAMHGRRPDVEIKAVLADSIRSKVHVAEDWPLHGAGPNLSVRRTPSHGLTGCGGCHRKSPTGGAAKGMPRNARTPSGPVVPSTTPIAVVTRSSARTPTDRAMVNSVLNNTIEHGFLRLIPGFLGVQKKLAGGLEARHVSIDSTR